MGLYFEGKCKFLFVCLFFECRIFWLFVFEVLFECMKKVIKDLDFYCLFENSYLNMFDIMVKWCGYVNKMVEGGLGEEGFNEV